MSDTPKAKPKAKETFVVGVGDPPTPTTYVVVRPSRKDLAAAETERAKVFTALLRSGALLAKEVDNVARQRNLWDDQREERETAIDAEIRDLLPVVRGEVEGTTKSAARKAAIRIRVLRMERMELGADRRQLYELTAEDKAGDAEFNFLIVRCTRTEDNRPVWESVDAMMEDERKDLREAAAKHFMGLHYGVDVKDSQRKLPENKFLLENGFCDDELFLIDPVTKKRVNVNGRPIDALGRLVNDAGELVNEAGERINEDGTVIRKTFPFLEG